MRLGGEARKGGGRTVALGPWAWGLRCRRTHDGGGAGPRPLEHEAQPHQGDQHQLIEKEMGDHGKTPSYRWKNEGILPGFSGCRISRRLEGYDPRADIRGQKIALRSVRASRVIRPEKMLDYCS